MILLRLQMDIDLKKIRAENGGLTQSELAERLGIKLRTVQKYETGSPIPLSMEKLISYEFQLDDRTNRREEYTIEELHQILDDISSRLSKKDSKSLAIIREELAKKEGMIEEYRNKYYSILEKLNVLKTYLIKTFDIPDKYLD
ncbi:MAG: helix-turn-helix transcriptional regulator [Cyclobacteriaceae bacterium]